MDEAVPFHSRKIGHHLIKRGIEPLPKPTKRFGDRSG
jgi:hypothetical protein